MLSQIVVEERLSFVILIQRSVSMLFESVGKGDCAAYIHQLVIYEDTINADIIRNIIPLTHFLFSYYFFFFFNFIANFTLSQIQSIKKAITTKFAVMLIISQTIILPSSYPNYIIKFVRSQVPFLTYISKFSSSLLYKFQTISLI